MRITRPSPAPPLLLRLLLKGGKKSFSQIAIACLASMTSCFASTSSGPRWTSRRRRSAVFFAALRAAVAHLLPSLSFPAKTNQQGHKAKEATSNEEAAAPACIWPSNGCCSPEIGAGKPSTTTQRTGGPPLVLNSEIARAFVLSVRSSGRAAPPSGRAFALSVLGNGPLQGRCYCEPLSLSAAHMPCLLA